MESKAVFCAVCGKTHAPDGRHAYEAHHCHARHDHNDHGHVHEHAHEGGCCCADGCGGGEGAHADGHAGDGCECEGSHGEGDGCGCGHEHAAADLSSAKGWLPIVLGGAVLAAAFMGKGFVSTILFFAAYIILGGPVLLQAVKDIKKGQIFGESFLMGVATIGAFAIGEYAEAVAVMLFYRVGEYFQELAVDRSRRSIRDVIDLRPEFARVQRGEDWIELNPAEVAVGERVLIKPGERVPLDGMVVEGESRVNNSALTGESVPEHVLQGKEVLAGGINQSSPFTIKVLRPLSESASSRVLRAVEDAAAGKPKLENFITRFAKVYTPIVVGLAVLVAVAPPVLGLGAWKEWFYRALMFLVISCPCALVLSVPMTFFAGLARASRRGVLFKGANRMEALAGAKAVVFDKTGTLTQGVFEVRKLAPSAGRTEGELITIAAAAEHFSPHPVAKAIRDAAGQYQAAEEAEEISGRGIRARVAGKSVLVGNARLLKEAGIPVEETVKGTVAYVADDGLFIGTIEIADVLKADAAQAMRAVNSQVGYTAIFTGDAEEPALRVAEETGAMDCRFKLLPEEKLSHMRQIRSERGRVAFVGDGMNDAPVLMGADVGIAVGGGGTDMAVEAADVVLLSKELMAVPDAVAISRRTIRIAHQNIVFAIGVKVVVMALDLLGFASMWMAVFADVGTALLCVLNALRLLAGSRSNKY